MTTVRMNVYLPRWRVRVGVAAIWLLVLVVKDTDRLVNAVLSWVRRGVKVR